ncbi:hypothetical protein ABZ897_61800 [Nonomuraea sp. NPDC046802]
MIAEARLLTITSSDSGGTDPTAHPKSEESRDFLSRAVHTGQAFMLLSCP